MARRLSTERAASSTKVRGTVAILQEEQEASDRHDRRPLVSVVRGKWVPYLPTGERPGGGSRWWVWWWWKPVVGLVVVETGGGSGGGGNRWWVWWRWKPVVGLVDRWRPVDRGGGSGGWPMDSGGGCCGGGGWSPVSQPTESPAQAAVATSSARCARTALARSGALIMSVTGTASALVSCCQIPSSIGRSSDSTLARRSGQVPVGSSVSHST